MRLHLHYDDQLRSIEVDSPMGYDSPDPYLHMPSRDGLNVYLIRPKHTYNFHPGGTTDHD